MFTFNLFTRKVGAGNDWYEMIFTFNMRFTQVMVFSLQETILKSKPPMNLKNHKALTFCFQMLQVQTWLMCSPVKQTWCQVTCKRLSRWFCWHIKFKRITSDSWVDNCFELLFLPKKQRQQVLLVLLVFWHSWVGFSGQYHLQSPLAILDQQEKTATGSFGIYGSTASEETSRVWKSILVTQEIATLPETN